MRLNMIALISALVNVNKDPESDKSTFESKVGGGIVARTVGTVFFAFGAIVVCAVDNCVKDATSPFSSNTKQENKC